MSETLFSDGLNPLCGKTARVASGRHTLPRFAVGRLLEHIIRGRLKSVFQTALIRYTAKAGCVAGATTLPHAPHLRCRRNACFQTACCPTCRVSPRGDARGRCGTANPCILPENPNRVRGLRAHPASTARGRLKIGKTVFGYAEAALSDGLCPFCAAVETLQKGGQRVVGGGEAEAVQEAEGYEGGVVHHAALRDGGGGVGGGHQGEGGDFAVLVLRGEAGRQLEVEDVQVFAVQAAFDGVDAEEGFGGLGGEFGRDAGFFPGFSAHGGGRGFACCDAAAGEVVEFAGIDGFVRAAAGDPEAQAVGCLAEAVEVDGAAGEAERAEGGAFEGEEDAACCVAHVVFFVAPAAEEAGLVPAAGGVLQDLPRAVPVAGFEREAV